MRNSDHETILATAAWSFNPGQYHWRPSTVNVLDGLIKDGQIRGPGEFLFFA